MSEKILIEALRLEASARHDFNKAFEAIGALRGSTSLQEAVFTGAVIIYARPFVAAKGRSTYPLRRLKKHPQFDIAIHQHLLEARHRLLAHADSDVLKTDVALGTVDVEVDGVSNRVTFSVMTFDKGFRSFRSPLFVQRLLSHIQACAQVTDVEWGAAASRLLSFLSKKEEVVRRGEPFDRSTSVRVDTPHGLSVIGHPQLLKDIVDSPTISFSEQYDLEAVHQSVVATEAVVWSSTGDSITLELERSSLSFQDDSGTVLGQVIATKPRPA